MRALLLPALRWRDGSDSGAPPPVATSALPIVADAIPREIERLPPEVMDDIAGRLNRVAGKSGLDQIEAVIGVVAGIKDHAGG